MPLLILLFIVVPVAELYVIIKIGSVIGVLPTIGILLADAILGSLLLRHQGKAAWQRFNKALEERRFPGKEVADGLLITIGGTLLLTPGFLTDIAGLILLIPPSRAVVRRVLTAFLGRRFRLVSGPAQWGYTRMRGGGTPPAGGAPPASGRPGGGAERRGPAYDVEADAREVPVDPPALSPDGGGRSDAPEARGLDDDPEATGGAHPRP